MANLADDEWGRVPALRGALHALRSCGFVFLAADGIATHPVAARLFERTVTLVARGFSLARKTDSPLLPVSVRWSGTRTDLLRGDLIAPGEEVAMTEEFACEVEPFVRQHPHDLGSSFVEWFILRSPPLDQTVH